MSTGGKLAAFAAALAVVFGLAVVVGRAAGPVDEPAGADDTHAMDAGSDAHADADSHGGTAQRASDAVPGGLMTSEDGYRLDLARPTAAAGSGVPISFTVTGPDGSPVTSYDVEHEKRLHLIAVRRDFTGFQHLHPTLTDGVWSSEIDLTPGVWRIFADFKPTGGEAVTLGADLSVPGRYEPVATGPDSRVATVGGYRVTLDGDLEAGDDAMLTLGVSKDGKPVTDLEPYLGAYGHLVALRSGDLAYLHVHPDGTPDDGTTEPGPDVVFHTTAPSAGTYHLYLDFRHDGVVRTAAFTVTARSNPTEHSHSGTSGH